MKFVSDKYIRILCSSHRGRHGTIGVISCWLVCLSLSLRVRITILNLSISWLIGLWVLIRRTNWLTGTHVWLLLLLNWNNVSGLLDHGLSESSSAAVHAWWNLTICFSSKNLLTLHLSLLSCLCSSNANTNT